MSWEKERLKTRRLIRKTLHTCQRDMVEIRILVGKSRWRGASDGEQYNKSRIDNVGPTCARRKDLLLILRLRHTKRARFGERERSQLWKYLTLKYQWMSRNREIRATGNVCQKFGKFIKSESRILECMIKKEQCTKKQWKPRTDSWAASVFRKKSTSTTRAIQRIQGRDDQRARRKAEMLQRSPGRMVS